MITMQKKTKVVETNQLSQRMKKSAWWQMTPKASKPGIRPHITASLQKIIVTALTSQKKLVRIFIKK
jgi:hypothetical protein